MPKQLRDYQELCMTAVQEALMERAGTKVVAATGTGKGLLIGELVRRVQPKRVMVLAHVKEIIWQLRNHVEDQSEIECGVEMAELRVNKDLFRMPQVIVSTVQTQFSNMSDGHKRMARFRPQDFGMLITDECHHFGAEQFQNVINYYCQNPELKVVGFTATPNRHDKKGLPPQLQHTAFDFGIIKALAAGWLVDVTQQFVPVSGLDFSHVKTKAGDLDQHQLAEVMEAEEIVQGVCQPTLEVVFGLEPKTLANIPVPEWGTYLRGLNRVPRKAIVFTVRVKHAEALCNIFNRVLPEFSNFVSGKTHPDDRENIFKNFGSGKCPILANVSVIGEGIDIPGAEVCVMARPTKSLTAYLQWIGRVLRPLPGVVDGIPTPELRRAAIEVSPKPFARIVDFVGNSGRHKIVNSMMIRDDISEEVQARTLANILSKGKPVRVLRAMTNAQNELEAEKRRERERRERAAQRDREERLRRANMVAKAQFSMHDVNPFEGSVSNHWKKGATSKYGQPISDKMKYHLRRNGYNPDNMTFGYAIKLMDKIAEKERWPSWLKRHPDKAKTTTPTAQKEIEYVPGPF